MNALVCGELDALCKGVTGPVGVAVSGGSDSLALLYIAHAWARRAGRQLYGFTVDHGLRAEARAEAEEVGRHCAVLGIAHQILTWQPGTGAVSQNRARRARHGMLAEALRAVGGSHLLMGHTLDDQIETVAMRARRPGEGSRAGLAGMRALAVSPVWPEGRGVFVCRPCLGVCRGELRTFLREAGLDWAEDPSNENTAFERVRVRSQIKCSDDGLGDELLARMIAARKARQAEDKALVAWLDSTVRADDDGLVRCSPGELEPREFAEGLASVIMAAAGQDKRAGLGARLGLARDIGAAPGKWRGRTLGGAWLAPRRGEIHIARDPGGLRARPVHPSSQIYVWDGRFVLCAPNEAVEAQLARNLQPNLHGNMVRSPMARATYPDIVSASCTVRCLVPGRLEDVRKMLCHENALEEAV